MREIGVTPIYRKNKEAEKKTVVNVGGSGSSKSYSIAQLLVYKFVTESNKRFVIARKTMPACKRSNYDLIIGLLKAYKIGIGKDGKEISIYDIVDHNKTDHIIKYKNNEMLFMGLDEPTKIKSISTGVNYVWPEEANEFTYEDFKMFELQVRRATLETEPNHIYLSLNPIDESNWIPMRLLEKDDRGFLKNNDVEVIHSTYKDNPFLNEDYARMLENSINEDENFYRVYVLGEWGKLENLIYRNYKVIPELPDMGGAKWAYGLDFGWVHPTAIVKAYLYNDRFYLEERLYKTEWTNADIIEFFSHEDKGDIFADPSAKQMIEEINQAGYHCKEAHRDVKAGIDLCQRQTLLIPESSEHIIKEVRGFHWRKDKEGNIIPEQVKLHDDAMDAMRYVVFGITELYGFPTARRGGDMPQSSRSMRI